MPYISKDRRELFKNIELEGLSCEDEIQLYYNLYETCRKFVNGYLCLDAVNGDLNYCLSMLCKGYLSRKGMIKYQILDDIMKAIKLLEIQISDINNIRRFENILGTVECFKLEFYRRVASPYEDLKIKDNGDI